MKKKLIGVAALTATAALLLAGCGGTPAEPGGSGAPDSPQQAGPTDIKWSIWIGGAEDQQVCEQIGAMVTAAKPDITMRLLGATFTDYWT
ncbi:MAG: hypothetical protein LBK95_16760, partial [Bifidobacteriaceae bacterium]|nr:hypothetical protein [Bifidobacteriaceae bacterium]